MIEQQIVEQLEIIGNAVSNLEDSGYAKQICLDVETYNLISIIGSNITDQLTRIADALEQVEDTSIEDYELMQRNIVDLTKEEA